MRLGFKETPFDNNYWPFTCIIDLLNFKDTEGNELVIISSINISATASRCFIGHCTGKQKVVLKIPL